MSSNGDTKSNQFKSPHPQQLVAARSRKEQPKKMSFQSNSDVDLLAWAVGDIATFWVWAYIRTVICNNLPVEIPDMEPEDIFYERLKLTKNTTTTRERSFLIKDWFRELEKRTSYSDAYKVMIAVRDEWLYVYNHIKRTDWLEKNESSTCWLWDRMKKNNLFARNIPSWFHPVNARERFLAINATLGMFLPDQWMYAEEITHYRNEFTRLARRAYQDRNVPEKENNLCQLNVKIAKETKAKLNKMLKAKGAKQANYIEWLIIDDWLKSSLSRKEYEERKNN